jgi:Flp pilus assembly pilin Flp
MIRSNAAALARRFLADTSGTTAIEYALVAAGIGVAVAGTIWKVGADVRTTLYDKLVSLF